MTTPTLEAERAAPCPFCRSDKAHIFEPDGGGYAVLCYNCTAEGPLHVTSTDAIAAWNRRAAPVAEGVELPPKQSIGNDMQFHSLVMKVYEAEVYFAETAAQGGDTYDGFEKASVARKALIAYIDGRTAGAAPADPMDWPIPCDVKVGAVNIKKGCKLRTLVTRMESLHRMAAAAWPKLTQEQKDANWQALVLAAAPSQMDKGREGGK